MSFPVWCLATDGALLRRIGIDLTTTGWPLLLFWRRPTNAHSRSSHSTSFASTPSMYLRGRVIFPVNEIGAHDDLPVSFATIKSRSTCAITSAPGQSRDPRQPARHETTQLQFLGRNRTARVNHRILVANFVAQVRQHPQLSHIERVYCAIQAQYLKE
jgi:hypothetical protein